MTSHEHLLTCLAEECSEVQKHVCKALRFGPDDKDPTIAGAKAEFVLLRAELTDLFAVAELLRENGIITKPISRADVEKKKKKVLKFMRYARERGALA